MALVVFGEEQPVVPVEFRRVGLQFLLDQAFLEQLFLEPDGHRHAEGFEAARGQGDIGFEQPFELQEGLVVEGDEIDIAERRARFLQAIGHGVMGEARIVFLAGEALFLGRGHDTAVLDQRRRAVVIEGRDAQNPHGGSVRPKRSCR
jgi:hypothetical protein